MGYKDFAQFCEALKKARTIAKAEFFHYTLSGDEWVKFIHLCSQGYYFFHIETSQLIYSAN